MQRLEQVFELLGQRASAKTCEALEGLIREANETTGEIDDKQMLEEEKAADEKLSVIAEDQINQRAAA